MEKTEKTGPSLARRALAVVVLGVVAWLLLKVVLSVVAAVAWVVVAVIAVIGVLWALKTLF
ncbi:MAG: hypothetical protein QOJ97_922 [Solirubrobacteraceae bacterium]|jgi:hypothetical protein|nr:hypothetical protein [Solirubrobacteraceae bacterium]